jgi:uncharacterized membrane protein
MGSSYMATEVVQSLFRWIHIIAGITWIGLLYFFNWINGHFAKTLDGDSKKKVVPELLPRTLYWFRWGAAWTWISGVILLTVVFYHSGIVFDNGMWGMNAFVMLAVTFLGVFVYDAIMNMVDNKNIAVFISFLLLAGVVCLYDSWAGFSYRGYAIHLGALFGTCMAFNVWFRIWPAQQKIITAIKNGEAPDAKLAALAGLRSKHNTYMSVPLVWTMINAHHASAFANYYALIGFVAIGWAVTFWLYKKSATVKGF